MKLHFPELQPFISGLGLNINRMTIREYIKNILKYFLLLILLGVYLIYKQLSKVQGMAFSYGILKACKRCVYGKSREALIIISGTGYSRDGEALIVMNYRHRNWYRRGECLGFTRCGKCLAKIDNPSLDLPCKWKRLR